MGMMLSDLSPAFTTTKLSSTLTTSAVMTSPTRISLRLRLSSNSAANDSSPEAGADLGADFWDCGAEEMLAIKEEKTYSNRRLAPAGQVEHKATVQRWPPMLLASRHQPTIRSTKI